MGKSRKLRKPTKGWNAKLGQTVRLVTFTQANTVGLCRQQVKAGYKLLQAAKQISQRSPSPAANAASVLTIIPTKPTDLSQTRDKPAIRRTSCGAEPVLRQSS